MNNFVFQEEIGYFLSARFANVQKYYSVINNC